MSDDYEQRNVKLDGVTMTVSDVKELDSHDIYIGLLRMNKDIDWLKDMLALADRDKDDLKYIVELIKNMNERPIHITIEGVKK